MHPANLHVLRDQRRPSHRRGGLGWARPSGIRYPTSVTAAAGTDFRSGVTLARPAPGLRALVRAGCERAAAASSTLRIPHDLRSPHGAGRT